jgi:6-phosphofructokinase 1
LHQVNVDKWASNFGSLRLSHLELKMRFGVLTGGGDCPGLNGVIRGVVTKGVKEYGYEFVGFRDGWKGPLEGLTMPLDLATVKPMLTKGGTILGSSRPNPFKI